MSAVPDWPDGTDHHLQLRQHQRQPPQQPAVCLLEDSDCTRASEEKKNLKMTFSDTPCASVPSSASAACSTRCARATRSASPRSCRATGPMPLRGSRTTCARPETTSASRRRVSLPSATPYPAAHSIPMAVEKLNIPTYFILVPWCANTVVLMLWQKGGLKCKVKFKRAFKAMYKLLVH